MTYVDDDAADGHQYRVQAVTTGVHHTSQLIMGQLVSTAGQLLPHVLEAAEEAGVDVLQSSHLTLLASQACLHSQQSCGMLVSSLLPRSLPLAPLQMSRHSEQGLL